MYICNGRLAGVPRKVQNHELLRIFRKWYKIIFFFFSFYLTEVICANNPFRLLESYEKSWSRFIIFETSIKSKLCWNWDSRLFSLRNRCYISWPLYSFVFFNLMIDFSVLYMNFFIAILYRHHSNFQVKFKDICADNFEWYNVIIEIKMSLTS